VTGGGVGWENGALGVLWGRGTACASFSKVKMTLIRGVAPGSTGVTRCSECRPLKT
jgi:hypothetical protein